MQKNISWLAKNYPENLKTIMSELALTDKKLPQISNAIDCYKTTPSMKKYWNKIIIEKSKVLFDACSESLREINNEPLQKEN